MATCKSDVCNKPGGKLWGGYCFDCFEEECKSCGTNYQKNSKDYAHQNFLSKTPEICPKCAQKASNCRGTKGSRLRSYCADYNREHWHCPDCISGVIFSVNLHLCDDCDDEVDY